MAATEATHDDSNDAPIVNGHALDSLEGVMKAFNHLTEEYNDGDMYEISTLSGDDAVAIESRRSSFQHMGRLLDARCGGYVDVPVIKAQRDGTLKIEVHEA